MDADVDICKDLSALLSQGLGLPRSLGLCVLEASVDIFLGEVLHLVVGLARGEVPDVELNVLLDVGKRTRGNAIDGVWQHNTTSTTRIAFRPVDIEQVY